MKTKGKVLWLFLFLAGVAFILSPHPILAQEEKTDLTLELVSDRFYNKVTPGEDNVFFLEVRNTGSQAFTNIRLSSDKPEGWFIEFEPAVISYLGPGSFQTIDINIKPAASTYRGEYSVTLIAEVDGARKVRSMWFTVETSTSIWLWIGVTIAVFVIVGFVIVFLRLGRE